MANEYKKQFDDELIQAAVMGYANVMHMLLARGADANGKDKYGATVLQLASGSVRPVRGHAECVRLLLDAGADVNAKGQDDATALMWAAASRDAEVVRMLIDAGADLNAKGKEGMTAEQFAAEYGHEDIVALLHEHIMHAELPEARGPSGGKVDSPGI